MFANIILEDGSIVRAIIFAQHNETKTVDAHLLHSNGNIECKFGIDFNRVEHEENINDVP